jgi:hypothetical protein
MRDRCPPRPAGGRERTDGLRASAAGTDRREETMMRLPVRSESDAFRLLLLFVAVLGASLLVGWLLAAIAGVLVFGFAMLAGAIWDLHTSEPPSILADAERVGHRSGVHAPRLVLVVANATPRSDELLHALVRPGEPTPVLDVLAPVLQSKAHYVTTDIDEEKAKATLRLQTILAWASRQGLCASGEVGDPIDPLAGLADELRSHDVDEVLVTAHAPDRASWVEAALINGLRDQVHVPVRRLVVDRSGQ